MLTTERFILRQLMPGDESGILRLRSDENVNRYLTRQPTRELHEARAFITRINKGIIDKESIYWVIAQKSSNQFIGTACLWNIQPEDYRAEIGYELIFDFWRKGIMREVIPVIIEYAFKQMKLHSIEANLHPDNTSSIKLLEKNGFIREGYFREATWFEGKFLDSVVYSLVNAGS